MLRLKMGLLLLAGWGVAAPTFAQTDPTAKRAQLEVTLRATRAQVTAGSGFGIVADLVNKSDREIFLAPKYVNIYLPPELDPEAPRPWWANIRGVENPDSKNFYETITRLGPGDRTTAVWSGAASPDSQDSWGVSVRHYLNPLFLAPSEYAIKAVVLHWPDEASAVRKSNNYSSESAEIKVLVIAPLWVTIAGAILGGLVAYFLLPRARLRSDRIEKFGILTAVLLSLIVTVLIARISDSQNFIRVSINDFWGAIAIGFIANWGGIEVLRKYLPAQRPGESLGKPGGPAAPSSADKS